MNNLIQSSLKTLIQSLETYYSEGGYKLLHEL